MKGSKSSFKRTYCLFKKIFLFALSRIMLLLFCALVEGMSALKDSTSIAVSHKISFMYFAISKLKSHFASDVSRRKFACSSLLDAPVVEIADINQNLKIGLQMLVGVVKKVLLCFY